MSSSRISLRCVRAGIGRNLAANSMCIVAPGRRTAPGVAKQTSGNGMRPGRKLVFLSGAVLLWATVSRMAFAASNESDTVPRVDPAPCLAAIAANDDDKITAECGGLIDNEKTAKADRIKALIARAGVFARKDQPDRAVADYDTVL